MPIFLILRTWNHISNLNRSTINGAHRIFYNLFFEFKLVFIINKLKLACPANFLHRANWINSMRRRLKNFYNLCVSKVLVLFSYLNSRLISGASTFNKYYITVNFGNSVTKIRKFFDIDN